MNPLYPWSAVVGQDALKQALLWCAIDPAIGGVLVSGPRGVAKTTLARALSELVAGAFVELPLGATEERVAGTLDLDAALRERRAQFAPGLLARAHDGILYVDEVNLLPDSLVDLLLDAAASGKNTVERDGISHVHAARFVLIGSMNPEEGELRPQLIDRFGLAASAGGDIPPAQRSEILRRRLDFDRDPAAFRARFEREQRELHERCSRARERAAAIALDGPALDYVSERCHAAGVEGVRADLAMLRAARARAAWHGRQAIALEDVDAVAELALAHRRPKHAAPSGGGSSTPQAGGRVPSSGFTPQGRDPSATGFASQRAEHPDAVPVVATRGAPLPELIGPARARRRGHRGRASSSAQRGAIDWPATLQRDLRELRYRKSRRPAAQLWLLAVDCSSSMLRTGALSAAKGWVEALERSARKAGARVSLLTFRGREARVEITSSAGRSALSQAIAAFGGGGATPLHSALETAFTLAARARSRSPGTHARLILFTDARSRDRLPGFAERQPELERIVVDCERGPLLLGLGPQLAAALAARYIPWHGVQA
ncbi:MAG TPA: VWA domain-containing protein [Polyangiales bacterium]|nr:VWA domain-containing protein [Polyangiales bacterium]